LGNILQIVEFIAVTFYPLPQSHCAQVFLLNRYNEVKTANKSFLYMWQSSLIVCFTSKQCESFLKALPNKVYFVCSRH